MARKDPCDLLLRCTSSQLDALTAKLQLNPAFLPGSSEPTATRATAILNLVNQRGQKGIAALLRTLAQLGVGAEGELYWRTGA